MARQIVENARGKLVERATELFRRQGYLGTSVGEICQAAGLTKGAFFHHFESKEKLAEGCLGEWEKRVTAIYESAPFQSVTDPRERLMAAIDFFIGVFSNPGMYKSCLAGTTAQEVAETNPVLRDATQACFAAGAKQFEKLLDAACGAEGRTLDTASLAQMWIAILQGSLLLAKASRDESVIAANLRHFKRYIEAMFNTAENGKPPRSPKERAP
jgi:TetR/AcrR family transcriptional regulator, transcriptional repressor for nem operon